MNKTFATDAEFCGKVPLHQTNILQPHGFLLVLDPEHLEILQVSENIGELFQLEPSVLVHKQLDAYAPVETISAIRERVAANPQDRKPLLLTFSNKRFCCYLVVQTSLLLLEIERNISADELSQQDPEQYARVLEMVAAIERTRGLREVCETSIRELKRISGFDKVMAYKFDEEWNGEVIGEVCEPGMAAYYGLKFPATDIPKQARELYKRTPYRIIPTIDYNPVRLYPVLNPVTNTFTNLSDCSLRSVASVHLEYLRNMEINASISIRIVVNDQLWGLVACHHREPFYPSYWLRVVFELLSQLLSGKVAAFIAQEELAYSLGKTNAYVALSDAIHRKGLRSALREGDQLQALLQADGIAVISEGVINTYGQTPGHPEIEDLLLWLESGKEDEAYTYSSLPAVYEPAQRFADVASGLLVLPVDLHRRSFVLGFRQEAVRNIEWAGNPNEALQFEADRVRYHPRNSFATWVQSEKHRAEPWQKVELQIAERLRTTLISLQNGEM